MFTVYRVHRGGFIGLPLPAKNKLQALQRANVLVVPSYGIPTKQPSRAWVGGQYV